MSSNKRGNIFGQGKPERPYEERDDPADVPQKATAAQLAARKIKTAKARRPGGASSGLSQSANFGAPQQGDFNFGASAPAPGSTGANSFGGFGGGNAFGGGATNSFPPAQPSAPSNNFSASSFPAFGGNNQSTGFNPQPPSSTGFNFTAGGANPFATATSAPATNGNAAAPAFGGGASSMFGNAQPQSNPFGGLAQNNTTSSAPSGGMFGTSSAAPSGGMFGTSSAAPSGGLFGTSSTASAGGMFGTASAAPSGGLFGTSNATGGMFGSTSGAPNATSTPAPASTPFTFGAASTSAQNTASTPAPSGLFSSIGNSAQPAAPASNGIFSGFGANASKTETPKEPAAPQSNLFGGLGNNAQKNETSTESPKPQNNIFGGLTSAQGTPNASTTTPAFNFGATAQKSDNTTASAPSTNLFGTASSAASTTSTPAPAPASNPFASLPTAANTPSTPINLFGSLKKPAESSSDAAAETPKPNLFAGLSKPASTPAATPAASSSGFNMFGAAQNKDTESGSSEKNTSAATLKAPEAPKSSLFQPFSTPQPAKTTDTEKSQGGMFTAAQPKTSSGLFSQSFQSDTNNTSNLFNKPQSGFSFTPSSQTTPAPEAPAQQAAPKDTSNPFSSLSTPSTDRPNLFTAPKESTPASPTPLMPNLTGGAAASTGASQAAELPKVPRVHVPKEWPVPGSISAQSEDSWPTQIAHLKAQLLDFNEKYRQQLSSLPLDADWSAVSLWHHQHTTDIKKKIDHAKKQYASAKGVTGNETTRTKRKVDDETPEVRDPSPSKRPRAGDAPAPQAFTAASKPNPPATATSNMFAKAIGSKPSAASTPAATNLFAPKTAEKPSSEPSKPANSTGFGFTPSVPTTNGTSGSKAASSTGFTPSFGGGSASSGFKPSFGGSSTSGGSGGGFMAQFTKSAKTYEELAAERKQKFKEDDYDSDDETEEEWSARYDKLEAERLAKEKEIIAKAPGFSVPATDKPASNLFAGLSKPASGAPATGSTLFTPKAASPAPSTGSQSVFEAPSAAQTPSANIFGHLSSGASSNHQDESEEEDDGEPQQPVGSVESTTPPKPKFGETETESEGTQEEAAHKKQDTGSKGSLLSRITRDDDSETEKDNSKSTSIFGQANGTTTPSNKPFQFFDFGAASRGSSPKPDTFVGDQTYTPDKPLKFAEAPSTAPKFQFQPATPSAAEFSTTPAKPPPSSIFSSLVPSAGVSGATSVASSVFSSRAGTPLSEADTNAASNTEDDEEGGKQEQIDLSQLTEEELNVYDIVFHTEVVLAKHQVDKDGQKAWVNLAKGPLWILKDKESGKCSVRVRIASGATPLNYQILPSLPATVTGNSKKMVMSTKPAKEGGLQSVLYAVKSTEIAEEMAAKYMESRPST